MVGIVRAEQTDLLVYKLRHSRGRNAGRIYLDSFPFYAECVHITEDRAEFVID